MDIVKPRILQRFLTNTVWETWHTDRIQALRKRHELGSGWNKDAQADLEWLLKDRLRKVPKAPGLLGKRQCHLECEGV